MFSASGGSVFIVGLCCSRMTIQNAVERIHLAGIKPFVYNLIVRAYAVIAISSCLAKL